jgi:SAM-dependent methyltransferase
MSDEVRSNSSPAPPDVGAKPIDPVEGPTSLEIEFPTPDLELPESGSDPAGTLSASGPREPSATPVPASPPPTTPAPVSVLSPADAASGRSSPEASPRISERPPPPSQRPPNQRPEASAVTPIPPPLGGTTLPAPAVHTLPAPAPLLSPHMPAIPPLEPLSFPLDEPAAPMGAVEPPRAPLAASPDEGWGWTPPPPATGEPPTVRMHSEPVPLVTKTAAGPVKTIPPSKATLRPGLVEPKRIIEVLGSNVPVLDSALEEEKIEDLDDSEAHEVAETPVPDRTLPRDEPELELNVVIEDFPLSLDVPLDAPDLDAPAPLTPEVSTREASEADEASIAAALADETNNPTDAQAAAETDGAPEAAPGKRAKAPPNKRRRPPPPSSRINEKPKQEIAPPGARKWWEEMFSEEFLRAIPILSPKQLEREVNFIDEALSVDRGGRILDLACGAGQHAVELATRGYDLVGFDLSQSQLDWAGGLAQERNQKLQFTYGDMRDLSYNEAFDAVYSWNTSFGFFEEDKNVDVAQRVFRALRPGGRFLLDVINRDFVVEQQPGQTWFEGDGCVCIDDVFIDFITSRMKVKRTLMLTNGKNRECNYSVRIYGLHELGKILHDVGFKVLNVSGRPEMPGVFFGSSSPRIIILAVKPD